MQTNALGMFINNIVFNLAGQIIGKYTVLNDGLQYLWI